MSERQQQPESVANSPIDPRPVKPLGELRADVRTIRAEHSQHPEFAGHAIYWTQQVGVLTEALQQGELPPQEFNSLIGAMMAAQETTRDRDGLTDLLRRDAFIANSSALLSLARRNGQPASLAFIDLDHFKQINDGYGHDTGDAVLQQVSGFLRNELREHDLLGRLGGEELGLLLPFTTEDQAHDVLERLREDMPSAVGEALTNMGFTIAEPITMSVGVTEVAFTGDPHAKLEAAVVQNSIREADQRMYLAKNNGRNRVISSKNLPAPEQA